jgi:putative membrane protein
MKPGNNLYNRVLIILYTLVFIWSSIFPKEYYVWMLEISGVIFIILIYIYFYKKIKFTNTTNFWAFIAACLISVGAHYSFPNVPVFNDIKDLFGMERNNFDKLGHLVQGILPVLISREVIVKKNIIRNFFWINFFSFCVAMTVSGMYEIFEWFFIIVLGDNQYTSDVLGTQGYIWDSQSDMLFALIGAVLTILFGHKHLASISDSTHMPNQGNRL